VLEVEGKPIVATTCHCSSCRDAERQLEGLPGAAPILNKDRGTLFIFSKGSCALSARRHPPWRASAGPQIGHAARGGYMLQHCNVSRFHKRPLGVTLRYAFASRGPDARL
jgi:hypothetical protein